MFDAALVWNDDELTRKAGDPTTGTVSFWVLNVESCPFDDDDDEAPLAVANDRRNEILDNILE